MRNQNRPQSSPAVLLYELYHIFGFHIVIIAHFLCKPKFLLCNHHLILCLISILQDTRKGHQHPLCIRCIFNDRHSGYRIQFQNNVFDMIPIHVSSDTEMLTFSSSVYFMIAQIEMPYQLFFSLLSLIYEEFSYIMCIIYTNPTSDMREIL